MGDRVTTSKTEKPQDAGSEPARSELLLELHLESNPETLCLVRAALERAAGEVLKFRESESRAIVRAVDEALANIIRHAYEGRGGKPIEVSCRRLRSGKDAKKSLGIEIILSDSGVEADRSKLKSRALEEVRPGGLGLHLIQKSMDVVEFSRENNRNYLRLVKYLGPPKTGERKGE